jgi:hypothetical protein
MNERIEKLGEQADLLGEFTPTRIPGRYVGYITEEQILKFAELIVRECMSLASECSGKVHPDDLNELFKEHFGIC